MKKSTKMFIRGYFVIIAVLYVLASWIPANTKMMVERQIVSLGNAYFVVTDDNTLVGWGDNGRGLIGNGVFPIYPYLLRKTILKDVISVDAAAHHAIAADKNGALWGWGNTTLMPNQETPSGPIKLMEQVAAASTAFSHTAVLKQDGTLWVYGENGAGQLGQGYADEVYNLLHEPQMIMEDVIGVFADAHKTFAITSNHELYAWGGMVEAGTSDLWTPKKIADHIQDVNMGWGYQVLTTDGQVYHLYTEEGAPSVIVEDVREIFPGGLIKKDNSCWAWDSSDGNPTLIQVNDSVAHAANQHFYLTTNGFLHTESPERLIPAIPQSINTVKPLFRNLFLIPLLALTTIYQVNKRFSLKSSGAA